MISFSHVLLSSSLQTSQYSTIKPTCFAFGNLISPLDPISAILPTSCTTLINAPLLILVCLPTFHCSLLTKTGFQRPHWLSSLSLSQRAHLQIPSKRFTPTSVSIHPHHPLSLTISLQFHRPSLTTCRVIAPAQCFFALLLLNSSVNNKTFKLSHSCCCLLFGFRNSMIEPVQTVASVCCS